MRSAIQLFDDLLTRPDPAVALATEPVTTGNPQWDAAVAAACERAARLRGVEVPARTRRRTYTARYKLAALAEYEQLVREGKGALLRHEGLYTSLISEWRRNATAGRSRRSTTAACAAVGPTLKRRRSRGSRHPPRRPVA